MPDSIDVDDLFGVAHDTTPGEESVEVKQRQWPSRRRLRVLTGEQTAEMAAMYADGERLVEIADQFGIKPAAVSRRIQKLVDYWREQGLKSISEKQAQHLAGLDQLEMELRAAWYASQEGRVVTLSERTTMKPKGKASRRDKGTETLKEYERRESSPGDPRFMNLILEIRKERAKIWGLYAKDGKGGGPTGAGYDPEGLAVMSKAQLVGHFMAMIEAAKLEKARREAVEGLRLLNAQNLDIGPISSLSPEKSVTPVPVKAVQADPAEEDAMAEDDEW